MQDSIRAPHPSAPPLIETWQYIFVGVQQRYWCTPARWDYGSPYDTVDLKQKQDEASRSLTATKQPHPEDESACTACYWDMREVFRPIAHGLA